MSDTLPRTIVEDETQVILAAAGLDELDPAIDPYRCDACLRRGDSCQFHEGLGAGWDAAMTAVLAVMDRLTPDHLDPRT